MQCRRVAWAWVGWLQGSFLPNPGTASSRSPLLGSSLVLQLSASGRMGLLRNVASLLTQRLIRNSQKALHSIAFFGRRACEPADSCKGQQYTLNMFYAAAFICLQAYVCRHINKGVETTDKAACEGRWRGSFPNPPLGSEGGVAIAQRLWLTPRRF